MRFEPLGPLRGDLHPPPDKSVSHRAALIGAMAEGPTRITGYLDSADTRATLRAVSAVGAEVREGEADGRGGLFVEVEGIGLRGPRPAEIDVANAGTLLRLLPGWLAGQSGEEWVIDGDESIRRRPVDRIAEPLGLMGGDVEARDGRLPPLRVRGAQLRGIDYEMPVASAQVKSCLLFAGLLAAGNTRVTEPHWTRDHTERLEAGDVPVPGDFSSAAFFLVATLLVPGSEVSLRDVGINRARIGLMPILSRMGVEMGGAYETGRAVTVEEIREPGPEPIARLNVRSAALRGTEVTAEDVPSAIDELPLVALLGCFAEGETVVSGAAELRAKESDRIAGIVEGLTGLGAEIEGRPDGFAVRGTGGLRGGELDAHGDHRLAMVGAVAGLASSEGVEVRGFEVVEVSYPGFERDLRSLLG